MMTLKGNRYPPRTKPVKYASVPFFVRADAPDATALIVEHLTGGKGHREESDAASRTDADGDTGARAPSAEDMEPDERATS